MASGGVGGVFFFLFPVMTKLWLESAPLFQITWIRGQEGTMCAGIWHRPVLALPTHFIHPCWQPFIYSHSAVGTGRPNTLPKQRLLLKHDSANHCHTTTDRTWCVRVHPQTSCSGAPLQHHGQLSAILGTAIVVSTGLMTRTTTSPGNILTTQQPAGQHALTIGHFRLRCSKVKWPLDCFEHLLSILVFLSFSDCLICFCCNFDWIQHKGGWTRETNESAGSAALYDHHHLLHTHSQRYIIWCLHFLCAPLCSHYPPFIGCNSAAQHQTNSLSM